MLALWSFWAGVFLHSEAVLFLLIASLPSNRCQWKTRMNWGTEQLQFSYVQDETASSQASFQCRWLWSIHVVSFYLTSFYALPRKFSHFCFCKDEVSVINRLDDVSNPRQSIWFYHGKRSFNSKKKNTQNKKRRQVKLLQIRLMHWMKIAKRISVSLQHIQRDIIHDI